MVIELLSRHVLGRQVRGQAIRLRDCFLPMQFSGNFEDLSHVFRLQASADEPLAEQLAAAVLANLERHHTLQEQVEWALCSWDARYAPFCDPEGMRVGTGLFPGQVYLSVAQEVIAGNTSALVLRKLIEWRGHLLAESFVLRRDVTVEQVQACARLVCTRGTTERPTIHWIDLTAEQRHGRLLVSAT